MRNGRLPAFLLAFCLILCCLPLNGFAMGGELVILYENDMHCNLAGYAKLSALKTDLAQTYAHVGMVSVGDFAQGSPMGEVSRGEYVIGGMNLVGYDAVALGEHEFDYGLSRLMELTAMLQATPVCVNFRRLQDNTLVFEPYTLVTYGSITVAYLGVTTPETLTASAPDQFMDETGAYAYTFCAETLYQTVQAGIDAARADGADYVVALAHLGSEHPEDAFSAQSLVQNTTGLDVVLDGHSHSVVESLSIADQTGREVILSSTGTQLEYVGKLTITSDGEIQTELIHTEGLGSDPAMLTWLAQVEQAYATNANRPIGESLVTLTAMDEAGNRIIGHAQTNLGDFCADAFRLVTGAQIGVMNSGGICADLSAGALTYGDLSAVFPFAHTVCVAEVTGQAILDLLELGVRNYPEEGDVFLQVSGLTFRLDDTIPSGVQTDANGVFLGVTEPRRVWDVQVLEADGTYQPLDPARVYTLASHNSLLTGEGAASILKDAAVTVWQNMSDVQLLETYLTQYLGGVIGEDYAASQNRIQMAAQPVPEPPADPETPDVPAAPETPEDPDTPELPDEPEQPDVPDVPEKPEDPDNPENPDDPDLPDDPKQPDDPETPDAPNVPETPDTGDQAPLASWVLLWLPVTVMLLADLTRHRKKQTN